MGEPKQPQNIAVQLRREVDLRLEVEVVYSAIKSLVRLAGGHQSRTLAWRDRSKRSIISEVTKDCGRVEEDQGWE